MSSKGCESTESGNGNSSHTLDAAEKELARIEIKQRKEGENALRLSDSPRIMSPESAEKYV
jgi:hypothetical protein